MKPSSKTENSVSVPGAPPPASNKKWCEQTNVQAVFNRYFLFCSKVILFIYCRTCYVPQCVLLAKLEMQKRRFGFEATMT